MRLAAGELVWARLGWSWAGGERIEHRTKEEEDEARAEGSMGLPGYSPKGCDQFGRPSCRDRMGKVGGVGVDVSVSVCGVM